MGSSAGCIRSAPPFYLRPEFVWKPLSWKVSADYSTSHYAIRATLVRYIDSPNPYNLIQKWISQRVPHIQIANRRWSVSQTNAQIDSSSAVFNVSWPPNAGRLTIGKSLTKLSKRSTKCVNQPKWKNKRRESRRSLWVKQPLTIRNRLKASWESLRARSLSFNSRLMKGWMPKPRGSSQSSMPGLRAIQSSKTSWSCAKKIHNQESSAKDSKKYRTTSNAVQMVH